MSRDDFDAVASIRANLRRARRALLEHMSSQLDAYLDSPHGLDGYNYAARAAVDCDKLLDRLAMNAGKVA